MNTRLPNYIRPSRVAIAMFGLIDTNYSLDLVHNMYLVQENSGIVRSGISIEFYNKYRYYFISIE